MFCWLETKIESGDARAGHVSFIFETEHKTFEEVVEAFNEKKLVLGWRVVLGDPDPDGTKVAVKRQPRAVGSSSVMQVHPYGAQIRHARPEEVQQRKNRTLRLGEDWIKKNEEKPI